MKSSQVRQAFVDYFKRQNHTTVASSSLIPENDPTLLFANAGMNQFKNTFLGVEKRPYVRAVSVQKCVRAGGKHNDLDNVGFTARHHTFFEMLGNFSFGDYFKKEAIHFAWEFLTVDLKIPKEKLYVTVFESDDEAADIWHKQEGVPKDRIFRLGEKDNFWRMGDTGPCGPCTEIFYDHGPRAGREADPYKGIVAGEDRFVEIWNLVFMQFYESAPGKMEPLPKPSVDTGSGLERVTAALQGKLSNYDTDLFWSMIQKAAQISKKENLLSAIEELNRDGIQSKLDATTREQIAALRVIADHTRSCSLLLADGGLPSNEGRGYVIRRILRRAVRYCQLLSGDAFLPEIAKVFIIEMSAVYPELAQRKEHILATLKDEQDRFMQTLGTGTELLEQELKNLKSKNQKEISGAIAFKLYDTYGFPVDLTRLMAAEKGFSVNEAQFEKEMESAREKAKSSWKGKGLAADEAHLLQWAQAIRNQHQETKFVGYEALSSNGKILSLSNGKAMATSLKKGEAGLLALAQTPFYAEGGGQVGDQGEIKTSSGRATVLNTTKNQDIYIHHIEMLEGEFTAGAETQSQVSISERRQTASNHSATHLLHSALRTVLGTHVTQAGSLVDAAKTRFDFTHNKPLSSEELKKIEDLVNNEISAGHDVSAKVMPHKEAIQAGAMALFGEKYGDQVRVLRMGSFSCELCGGTHVSNTAQIRMFKVVSESGVSAGVRRLEAITGDVAVKYLMKNTEENLNARAHVGFNENWQQYMASELSPSNPAISDWIENKKSEIKNLEKEIKKLQGGQVDVDSLVAQAKTFNSKKGSARLVIADVGFDDRDVLSQLSDQLKNKIQLGAVIVIGTGDQTHPIIVSVSKELNPDITAGGLLKELAAVMGGKGGGRPDFAQGAVPDRTKIKDAIAKAEQMLGL